MSHWNDSARLHGIRVKSFFFDADTVNNAPDLADRVVPMLAGLPVSTMYTEEDRHNIKAGGLIAQPDVLLAFGDGLIAVEYKYAGYRPHNPERWPKEVRLKDMLQCLIAGYVAAQHYRQCTACVLRYHNACYLLTPEPEVIRIILALVPLARQYYGESRLVSASQLAQFAVERIQKAFPGPADSRSAEGRAAHDSLLKR